MHGKSCIDAFLRSSLQTLFTAMVSLSILLSTARHLHAQDKLYFNGYVQFSQGSYIFSTNTNTFYFTPGLRYESNRWNFSVSLPLVAQNSNLVTRVGGMLIPHGGGNTHSSNMGGNPGMSMMGKGSGGITTVAVGDLYLTGEYWIVDDSYDNNVPGVSFGLQIKVPTANTSNNFGTGKFDLGAGVTIRKTFASFVGLVNGGYLILGSSAGINLINTLTYGMGIGKLFSNDLSGLVYFQGYSRVLYGYAPPNQVSVGLNYQMSHDLTLSAALLKGLTDTAPSIGVMAGVRIEI